MTAPKIVPILGILPFPCPSLNLLAMRSLTCPELDRIA